MKPSLTDETKPSIDRLLAIMAALRHPETGCPWDLEQTFKTIAPYTVEEAYEVADAITRGKMDDLKEELGDLLLQIVFHAHMADEQKLFDFDAVAAALCDKLVSRHPHVFGDQTAANAAEVLTIWNAAKDSEKKNESAIDGVTLGLPALLRAQKLQKKAARARFEWPDAKAAWAKLEEELAELKETQNAADEAEEIGDVLFCLVNYARMKGHSAEDILAATNRKFERRFKAMESNLAAKGKTLETATLDDMLAAWASGKNQD
jgi:MazG family protein